MSQNKRTPAYGLEILECLYKANPHNRSVITCLINAYIQMKITNKALEIIENISQERKDILSLDFMAWYHHTKNNATLEYSYSKLKFNKDLNTIDLTDMEYIINQSKTIDNKNSHILKQGWEILFKLAFNGLPTGLRSILGKRIKSIVLIANNPDIPLNILQDCVKKILL